MPTSQVGATKSREILMEELKQLFKPEILSPNACWLDHSHCPYGFPAGRFLERPRSFCQAGICHKLDESTIQELVEVTQDMQGLLSRESTILSDRIEKMAFDEELDGQLLDRKILEAAARIIRDQFEDL